MKLPIDPTDNYASRTNIKTWRVNPELRKTTKRDSMSIEFLDSLGGLTPVLS